MELSENKKKLIILSSDHRISAFLVGVIKPIIGHELDIHGYSFDHDLTGTLSADLVVITWPFIHPRAEQLFPGVSILEAKLVISGLNLDRLIIEPAGHRALVVMRYRTASESVIQTLLSLGIDHLEYEASWEDKQVDLSQFDLIISPGMLRQISPCNVPIINIGQRTFSIETFAQILSRFQLDICYLETFENHYFRMLIDASHRIKDLLDQSEQRRRYQTVLMHEVDEGILAYDAKKKVLIANPVIERLFGRAEELEKNREFQALLARLEQEETYRDEKSESERSSALLLRYGEKQIYCRKSIVELETEKHVLYTFKWVDQIQTLEQSVRRKLYHKGFTAKYRFNDIWGSTQEVEKVKTRAARFAATDQTILITGESGTGKEVLAHAIHNASGRAKGPFVGVNFAAITQSLVESELFGYQEGAFTGAKKGGKQGFFELAHKGTIFLDEIGDAPLHIQLLLLRVLEEREITRVGGEQNIPIDVRVIAATNKSLEDEIVKGNFRSDLFYRLNVLPIRTVPLRRVAQEIPVFSLRYLQSRFGKSKDISPSLMELLTRYEWPGNFREMKNVLDYMYYSSIGRESLEPDDLPDYIMEKVCPAAAGETHADSADWDLIDQSPVAATVLRHYNAIYPSSMGRKTLIDRMRAQFPDFTESAAKHMLRQLHGMGFLAVVSTRQGSVITERGRLLFLNKSNL